MPHDVEMPPDTEPSLASFASLIVRDQRYAEKQARINEGQRARRARGMQTATVDQQRKRGRDNARAQRNPAWDRDSVLRALRDSHAEHGVWPTGRSWERAGEGRPTSARVRQLFGTWAEAIEAAQG